MRLSDHEIASILKTARQIYGNDVQVYLYGSRVDDTKKGGDIDLLITSSESDANLLNLENKLNFLAELQDKIGDQKIDVVYVNIPEGTRESEKEQKRQFLCQIRRESMQLQ
jgi:predicted nucleotidyltransferase